MHRDASLAPFQEQAAASDSPKVDVYNQDPQPWECCQPAD